MIGCLSGIFGLSIYLVLTIVFGILALIPLAAADAIYTGKWTTITIHDLLMLENSAFANALGDVLSDHPLWQMFHGIIGGLANQFNIGINMQVFFADAANLNLNLYGILELIGSTVFMLLWFRVQMDVLSGIFRLRSMSTFDAENGVIGCILERLLNGLYFSVALLGAFFSTILFNAVKESPYPQIYIIIILAIEVVLFFGSRAISISNSNFQTSLLEEIIQSLLKTGTMFVSMFISFFYFSGGLSNEDWRIILVVLSWISAMNGIAGASMVYQIGGFVVTVILGCLMGI